MKENNSLWSHPSVYITPHIPGQSNQNSASKTIAENIHRIQEAEFPYPTYNMTNGY